MDKPKNNAYNPPPLAPLSPKQKLVYMLIYGMLRLLAFLPLSVLYLLGDVLRFIIFDWLKYRKKVVQQNLQNAFPNKTNAERIHIEKRFYVHFMDNIMEVIKLMGGNFEQRRAMYEVDLHLIAEAYSKNKTVYLLLPHQFSWELGGWLLNKLIPQQLLVIYSPIKNPVFDKIFYDYRSALGALFYTPAQTPLMIQKLQSMPCALGLAADQTPSNLAKARWRDFFNQKAPFHPGFEDIPRALGGMVIGIELIRLRRGKYKAVLHQMVEEASKSPEGEITDCYVQMIEQSVIRQPENYLWTHKRWKHSNKYEQYALKPH